MGDDDKCEGDPIDIEMDFNTPAAARCDIFNGGERPSVKILDDKYYLEEVLLNTGPNRINLPKEHAFVSWYSVALLNIGIASKESGLSI